MATEHEWVADNGDVVEVEAEYEHVGGAVVCVTHLGEMECVSIPADVLPNVAAALQAMSERASDE